MRLRLFVREDERLADLSRDGLHLRGAPVPSYFSAAGFLILASPLPGLKPPLCLVFSVSLKGLISNSLDKTIKKIWFPIFSPSE